MNETPQKHAPGVLCYIINHIGSSNEGKFVELVSKKLPGAIFQCVCGTRMRLESGGSDPVWEVKGKDLLTDCKVYPGTPVVSEWFLQSQLVPISAPGLADEILLESTEPTVLDKVLEEIANGSLSY